MRAVVSNACAALVAAALAVLTAAPAGASFEIRPLDPVSGPQLPASPPPPFGGPSCPVGSGWHLGTLHLDPCGLSELSYDALAASFAVARWGLNAGLARLGSPGYSEWQAAAGASAPWGLAAQASIFATQPEDGLRAESGLRPARAASISLGWSGVWRTHLRCSVWARDLLASPGGRALGIFPVPSATLEWRAARAWTFGLRRSWRSSPLPRARLEWYLGLDPGGAVATSHAFTGSPAGAVHSLCARAGRVLAAVWMAQAGPGLPPSTGLLLTVHGLRPAVEAAGPPLLPPAPLTAAAPAVAPPTPTHRAAGAASGPWAEELDAPLLLDGRTLTSWVAQDSMGARADSLLCAAGTVGLAGPTLGGPTLARREAQESAEAIPFDRAGKEDLVRLGGIPLQAADSLVALLRDPLAARLGDLEAVPQRLRPALLAVAPYLRDASGSAGDASGSSGAASADGPDPRSLRWSRSMRAGKGRLPQAENLLELRRETAWGRLSGRLCASEGKGAARLRGVAAASLGPAQITLGRAGPPLLWGLGLVARPAPVLLRSLRSPQRDGPRNGGEARSAETEAAPFFSPSLGGTRRFLGVEAGDRRPGGRWFFLKEDRAATLGWKVEGDGYGAGILLRGQSRRRTGRSLWLAHRPPGQEISLEWGGPGLSGDALGLRWSRANGRRGGGRSLWWDLFLREPAAWPFRRGGAVFSSTGERSRRLRAGAALAGFLLSTEIAGSSRPSDADRRLAASGARTVRGEGSGAFAHLVRWGIRGEETRQWRGPVPLPDGGAEGTLRRRRHLRLQAHAQAHNRLLPGGTETGLEWGADERRSPAASAGERVILSRWWGAFLSGHVGSGLAWAAGFLETQSPPATTLSVAPVWAGGSRFSLPGAGLWFAASAQARFGPCLLRARGLGPVWRQDPARPAAPGGELSLQFTS